MMPQETPKVSCGRQTSWGRVPESRLLRWGIPSLLVICGLILLFYRLGQLALYDSGEARYPLAALMMEVRQNWMVPFRRGDVWLNKPPLNMWLIHLAGLVTGGIDEWPARIPPASAALGTVLLIFWWGRRLGGALFGGIAGFALLTSAHFLIMGRTSYADQVFTFFFTLSLVTFYAVHHGWWEEKAWWIMYAAMGLATLAKGPMGLLLSIPVICTYLAIEKDLSALHRMRWVSGLMIYAAITLPWYLGVLLWYGESPWPGIYNIIHPFRPSARDLPWYYYGLYVVSFPLSFAPWSLFLPGLYVAWRRYRDAEEKVPDALRFAIIWSLLLFLVFSLAKTKRPYYLLPILPPASLMVAYVWAYLTRTAAEGQRWFHRYLQATFSGLLGLAISLMIVMALEGLGITGRLIGVNRPLVASICLTLLPVCLLLALRHIRRRRYLPTFGVLGAAFFWFWLWAIVFYAPTWDHNRSAKVIGTSLRQLVPRGTEIWMYRDHSDSISVYFGRDIRPLGNLDPVDRRVQRKGSLYLLAHEGNVGDILTRYPRLFQRCGRFYYQKRHVNLVLLSSQRCPTDSIESSFPGGRLRRVALTVERMQGW